MKPLRVGLVGAGFAAHYHEQCLRRVYGVPLEIAGVTSLRAESREAFAAARGLRAYESVEDLLADVDILDVLSPPSAHYEQMLQAAAAGKHVIVEKPLTGYFGPPEPPLPQGEGAGGEAWRGDLAPKRPMLAAVMEGLSALAAAVAEAGVICGYAENFVYAPAVQKEREILEKTGAQVLRMYGEESHNGSASAVYGIWRFAGGGSLIGKGCHPLGALLYLKRVEGLARFGRPLRPATVSARVHEITRLPGYDDQGFLRTDYHDIEDYGQMHIVFEDGTVADVITCELVLGGIYDYVEVFANNHRARCRLNPNDLMDAFNPRGENFADIYTVEKISTKEGWSPVAPDEYFTMGYQAELQDFLECIATGRQPQSGLELAIDTTATIYAAYVSAEEGGKEEQVPRVGE
jgi:predicted dehydrogenase